MPSEPNAPLDPELIQAFLDGLDEAGERLREIIDDDAGADSPAVQFYLEGSAFLEAGYLMVEHLAERFPAIFRPFHEVYLPLFERARKGQIAWSEALSELPEFLREFAIEKINRDLLEGGPEE